MRIVWRPRASGTESRSFTAPPRSACFGISAFIAASGPGRIAWNVARPGGNSSMNQFVWPAGRSLLRSYTQGNAVYGRPLALRSGDTGHRSLSKITLASAGCESICRKSPRIV